jgi:hypothetical protein
MRAHGFGMMAELERDIFYQNVENAGAMRPGKPILKLQVRY